MFRLLNGYIWLVHNYIYLYRHSHPSALTDVSAVSRMFADSLPHYVLPSAIDLRWSRSFLVLNFSSPDDMRMRSLLMIVVSVVTQLPAQKAGES